MTRKVVRDDTDEKMGRLVPDEMTRYEIILARAILRCVQQCECAPRDRAHPPERERSPARQQALATQVDSCAALYITTWYDLPSYECFIALKGSHF